MQSQRQELGVKMAFSRYSRTHILNDGRSYGTAQVANLIRRAVENDRKINMIAEGIQLAEDKKNWRELEY